jgi:hypothetical protein
MPQPRQLMSILHSTGATISTSTGTIKLDPQKHFMEIVATSRVFASPTFENLVGSDAADDFYLAPSALQGLADEFRDIHDLNRNLVPLDISCHGPYALLAGSDNRLCTGAQDFLYLPLRNL